MPRVTPKPPVPRPFPRRFAPALVALAVLGLSACNDEGSISQNNSSSTSSNSSDGTSTDGTAGAHTETNRYEITDKVAQLHLEGKAGKVSVAAGDGPISVTETLVYTDSKPTTSHNVTGDTLNLRNDGCPEQTSVVNRRCQVGWEIRVPAGTNLDLNTRAGGIDLAGMAGTVTANTHSGGVDGKDLRSKAVTAQTHSGGVDLQFREAPDQVKAVTKAGGVDIQVPAGVRYAVRTDTSAGRPEVEVQQDNASPHKIDASTGAGSIDITNGND
ncbi:hypothetical protein GCM10023321_55600 [Pseudonocardia eucalypti]|uniref:DUF4097 domain-containing protein n=1 Tax=Pseudonocardia eucalypti TaxID=648755 RepID=A0ABP9QQ97_9PSEU